MSERFASVVSANLALYKCSSFPFLCIGWQLSDFSIIIVSCCPLRLSVGSVSHASGRPHASPTPDLMDLTLRQRSNDQYPAAGTTVERYRPLLSGVDDSRV